MSILAVVPARGGSKGLRRKNVIPLGGRPMLDYTVRSGRACPAITNLVVSTDDDEIAAVARESGAEVPFRRPAELSTDTASSVDVAIHALQFMEHARGQEYDAVLLLQPTSPLRSTGDIDAAIGVFCSEQADSVISVYPYTGPPPEYLYRLSEHQVDPVVGCGAATRRQELGPCFVRNGAIYLTARTVLVSTRSFYGPRLRAIVMPEERSVNVDSQKDLDLAERLIAENGW